MNRGRSAPPSGLVILTGVVLAAHLALLQARTDTVLQPGRDAAASFVTRTVAPAPVAPPPPATPPAPEPARAVATPRGEDKPAPATAPVHPAANPVPAQVANPPAPAAEPAPVAAAPAPPVLGGDVSQLPQALALPVPSRMRYEVVAEARGITLTGQATLDWRHDGTQYEARLELGGPLLPTRVQRSVGRITEDGLEPTTFYDKSRTEQATHFERDKGRVTFSNNQPEAALAPGIQDRLSVVVQLSVLIGGRPADFPPGTRLAIPTASTREAEPWIFRVEGEEDLQLPGGAMRALKLQRVPRKEFDQKVELWLAPRLDYAPVRLRLTNPNGDTVDQRWSSTDKG